MANTSVSVRTQPTTRDLLAMFAGNQRLIKLFENLAHDVSTSLPGGLDQVQEAGDSTRALAVLVQAIAQQALELARQSVETPSRPDAAGSVDALPAASPQVFEGFAVGMIAMTVDPTNPSLTLGYGVWAAWGSGHVPVSYLAGDPDFGTVEGTGGFKTVSIPDHTPHTHTFSDHVSASAVAVQTGLGTIVTGTVTNGGGATAAEITALAHTDSRTGSGAIAILQPFIVAYFWKRTA